MRFILTFSLLFIITACSTIELPKLPFDVRGIMNRLNGELKATDPDIMIGDPVFIRIFKEENILELWMQPADSQQFELVKIYPICNWSGMLGPKLREGDRQAPEGFYKVEEAWLNPNSRFHIAMNIQYPNDYDRAHGRTGSFLMIHGDCVSDGCYAMTDPLMEEIYTLTERALANGQVSVPVHIFPFRMTSERILPEVANPWFEFWMNLKEGHDYFERYKTPPMHAVNQKRYEFY